MCGEQRAQESRKRTSVRPLRGWLHHAFGLCCHRWPVEWFTGWGEEWILQDKDPEHTTKSTMDHLKRWKLKVLKERISNNPSNKNLKFPTKCRWICRWQRWTERLFVFHRWKQVWKNPPWCPQSLCVKLCEIKWCPGVRLSADDGSVFAASDDFSSLTHDLWHVSYRAKIEIIVEQRFPSKWISSFILENKSHDFVKSSRKPLFPVLAVHPQMMLYFWGIAVLSCYCVIIRHNRCKIKWQKEHLVIYF